MRFASLDNACALPGVNLSSRRYAGITAQRLTTVMGPPEQRCWAKREQVVGRGDQNVAGAVLGAIVGGVLRHQVGDGRGKDVATAGGAFAGALIGSNSGVGDNVAYDRNVQGCSNVSSGRPAYWDVIYNYRGVEHRVQISAPPGNTIFVNRDGLPRQQRLTYSG